MNNSADTTLLKPDRRCCSQAT